MGVRSCSHIEESEERQPFLVVCGSVVELEVAPPHESKSVVIFAVCGGIMPLTPKLQLPVLFDTKNVPAFGTYGYAKMADDIGLGTNVSLRAPLETK